MIGRSPLSSSYFRFLKIRVEAIFTDISCSPLRFKRVMLCFPMTRRWDIVAVIVPTCITTRLLSKVSKLKVEKVHMVAKLVV